jgi:CRISPR/Cas system type I-B associated protein Csh2 (Cas7 group RAMP superfamily)
VDLEFEQALAQLEAPLISATDAAGTVSEAGSHEIGARLEATIRNWERAFEAQDRAFWVARDRLNERLRSIEERVAKIERLRN